MKRFLFVLAVVACLFPASAFAQFQLGAGTTTFTFTNFDGSGFAPNPAVGQLDSDFWKITGLSDGDTTFGGTHDTGDYARGTSAGGETGGGIYAFTGFGNLVTLGVQPTGSDFTPGAVILYVQNNTGAPIFSFDVTFDGHYNNDQNRSSSVILGHSPDDVTYLDEPSSFLATPEASDANGWVGGVPTLVTVTPATPIPPNGVYYFRWLSDDLAGSGSRDEMGLAAIAITPQGPVICGSDADCADAEFCNGDEVCNPASPNADINGCVAGTAVDPNDGFSCTTDSCDEVNDVVVNAPDNALCDNQMYCDGTETCDTADPNADATTGCLAGTPIPVDDGVVCTVDSCDEVNDVVVNTADDTLCNDNDTCTADTCDAVNDCQFADIGCTINATCYADGALNPNNACETCDIATDTAAWSFVAAATECGIAMCVAGDLAPAPLCDGAGVCVPGNNTVCANGCMNGMCNAPCTVDADCAIGWCDAGMCSTANRPPVAVIAPVDTVEVGDSGGSFSVDGSGSTDPDADPLTYLWSTISAGGVSPLTFDDDTAAMPTVNIPLGVSGDFELGLVVNDGTEDSAQTTVTVTIVMDDSDMGNANNVNNVNNANNANNANNGMDMGTGDDMGSPTKPIDEGGCCATNGATDQSSLFLLLALCVAAGRLRRRSGRDDQ